MLVQLGEDGELYVALKPIIEALGLDWASQLQRVKRNAVLRKHLAALSMVVTTIEGRNPQTGKVICLPKKYISGFLFGINANRIRDKVIREKIILFQEEAHLILDAAFTGDEDSAMEAMRQRYLCHGYDEAWLKQRQVTIKT